MAGALARAAATGAARQRRASRASGRAANMQWFTEQVNKRIVLTMWQRVLLAVDMLQNQVVRNISIPVKKETGSRSGRMVVTERSKKGEYPRADTTRLMKDVFRDVVWKKRGVVEGYVGTTLDYGMILETSRRLDRSFLVRTLNEMRPIIVKVLSGPVRR